MNEVYYCPYPDAGKTVTLSGDQLGVYPGNVITIEEVPNNTPFKELIEVEAVLCYEDDEGNKYHYGRIHEIESEINQICWRDENGEVSKVIGAFRLFRIIDIRQ